MKIKTKTVKNKFEDDLKHADIIVFYDGNQASSYMKKAKEKGFLCFRAEIEDKDIEAMKMFKLSLRTKKTNRIVVCVKKNIKKSFEEALGVTLEE